MIGELIHHEIVVKYGIKSFAYPGNASMIGELIHHEIVVTNFTKKLWQSREKHALLSLSEPVQYWNMHADVPRAVGPTDVATHRRGGPAGCAAARRAALGCAALLCLNELAI